MEGSKNMFYLRKEPYEQIIPKIEKTDGTIIPERKIISDGRALYKANGMSRFYRRSYTGLKQEGFRLYQVKKLDTIFNKRENLHEYCGEWFDVYDENGKVDISNVVKCKKSFLIEKCDGDGFTIPNKYYTTNEGEIWSIDKDENNKFLGGEVRLTRDTKRGCSWMEIPKEMFEEYFEKIC
jgi:hypothetical protein